MLYAKNLNPAIGFQLTHSFGGGTESGMRTLLISKILTRIEKKTRQMVGDELSHFKQAKTEVKTEVNSGQTTKSGGDFEDLGKDVSPFEISKRPTKLPPAHKGFGSDDASDNPTFSLT